MNNKKLVLYTDGASKGNPGKGGYGYVVEENNKILETGYAPLGRVTNNIAEYIAIIKGLEKCLDLKADEVELRSDSELIIKQLKGEYKVRSQNLLPLFENVKKLCSMLSHVSFIHINREKNTLADKLANKAINSIR